MADPQSAAKIPYQFIQPIDDETSLPSPPPEKPRTKWEKLGTYNFWVLILGTIIILISIAFLAFMWAVAWRRNETEHIPRLWIEIVSRNWTARVVTLATLLARVAIAAQLCVFAAIMAAFILERVGASNEDFPMLSMIRCANTGPQALIWNVFHTITKRSQLAYSFIIVVTILNALALQFMSTILLADFDNDLVILDHYNDDILWGVDASRAEIVTAGSDYWRSSQESMPTFAEYSHNGSHGANFTDTGLTYRGFLPFSNATLRENILSYSGPMTVVDERVVCVKPTLSNATFSIPAATDDVLSATFNFNHTHPDIVQLGDKTKFTCTMPHSWHEHATNYWYLSICRLELGFAELAGGILPDDVERTHQTNVWVVFNVTSAWTRDEEWLEMVPSKEDTVTLSLRQVDSPDGPWTKLVNPNITVDASLCVFNPKPDVYEVETKGSRFTFPSDSKLYWNSTSQKYDTLWARLQLQGIGPTELEEIGYPSNYTFDQETRGVLALEPVSNWNDYRATTKYHARYQDVIHGSLDKNKPWYYAGNINDSFVVTPKAGIADAIHRNHMWILQDTLRSTSNPAIGIQAVTHVVMQNAYYDWFANYDLNSTATYSMTESRYIPVIWMHFTVVAALLALHFVLLITAVVLFFTKTDVSLLGNAWQAVAQVYSNDTAAAFQHGTMATDEEVRHSVKSTGFHKSRVMIRRSERNGRLEAISVKPDS
ncbi:hypothetical protein EK21DRAFT_89660 [Setomelanomma holmii]|uniref:Uncharacterized protein n=1 Tax=Setomelanomma holmii TaxID=210430 RepID=A0A9P4H8E7_9PLEO|nr:hypothetical protein EK21DRAFT_89660 [Setomelanomma holmii]